MMLLMKNNQRKKLKMRLRTRSTGTY